MFLIDLKAGGRGQEVGGFFTLTGYNCVGNSQEKKKPCRGKTPALSYFKYS